MSTYEPIARCVPTGANRRTEWSWRETPAECVPLRENVACWVIRIMHWRVNSASGWTFSMVFSSDAVQAGQRSPLLDDGQLVWSKRFPVATVNCLISIFSTGGYFYLEPRTLQVLFCQCVLNVPDKLGYSPKRKVPDRTPPKPEFQASCSWVLFVRSTFKLAWIWSESNTWQLHYSRDQLKRSWRHHSGVSFERCRNQQWSPRYPLFCYDNESTNVLIEYEHP